MASFFSIFHALSFELTFFDRSFPLIHKAGKLCYFFEVL